MTTSKDISGKGERGWEGGGGGIGPNNPAQHTKIDAAGATLHKVVVLALVIEAHAVNLVAVEVSPENISVSLGQYYQ